MTDQLSIQKQSYHEELEDPKWKKKRLSIIERDSYQCRQCGSQKGLQVHHRQYHRHRVSGEWLKPWEYESQLLVTLCEDCHRAGHKQYSIPIKDI